VTKVGAGGTGKLYGNSEDEVEERVEAEEVRWEEESLESALAKSEAVCKTKERRSKRARAASCILTETCLPRMARNECSLITSGASDDGQTTYGGPRPSKETHMRPRSSIRSSGRCPSSFVDDVWYGRSTADRARSSAFVVEGPYAGSSGRVR
jgi:hypothetical protein